MNEKYSTYPQLPMEAIAMILSASVMKDQKNWLIGGQPKCLPHIVFAARLLLNSFCFDKSSI